MIELTRNASIELTTKLRELDERATAARKLARELEIDARELRKFIARVAKQASH